MYTPSSLSNQHVFELSLGFSNITLKDAADIVSWLGTESNWKYSSSNTDKIFTQIFSGTETDIKHFNKITFEQKLNAQRPVPSNGTVVFENWPSGLSAPIVELKLTDHEASLNNDNSPKSSGKVTNVTRYPTVSISASWEQ